MKMHVTTTCTGCDGDCRVMHPLWKQYNAQLGQLSQDDFFWEAGYLPTDKLPDLMINCEACKGTGEVATWLPIAQVMKGLQLLGVVLYKVLGGAPL